MINTKIMMQKSFYWFIGISLFLLPLINAWMLYPLGIENNNTLYSALGGILPWSDAVGYYSGANTLLENGTLDYWNTRRPLNAILFSIRLWLVNDNFKMALMIQALLCGVSCLLVTKSIARKFGKVSSAATLFILFLYAAIFIPTALTETLGLTLGCFGFVFLWEGITTKRTWAFFYAGLILMVGLNVRAGAFFILPLIIVWLGYHFKKDTSKIFSFNWRFSLSFTLGLLVALLFNLIILNLYNAPNGGALHGNFALTLFGFVSGGEMWTYAYTIYPEIATKSEAEVAKFLYIKSYETFKENPFLLLLGGLKNLSELFKAAISFFKTGLPSSLLLKGLIRFSGIAVLSLGFWRLKKLYRINKNEIGLIIIVLVGMILSASIIWRDGGFRVFAVTIPFFAAVFGVIVGSYRLADFKTQALYPKGKHPLTHWETKIAFALSSLLLALSLADPLFIKTLQTPLSFSNAHFSCASGETTLITKKISGAPYINLTLKAEQFRKTVLRSIIENKEPFLRILEPDILKKNTALGLVYDLKAKSTKYMVAPIDLFSNYHTPTGICATQITGANDIILQVKSFEALSE